MKIRSRPQTMHLGPCGIGVPRGLGATNVGTGEPALLGACASSVKAAHCRRVPKLRDWSRDESHKCFAIREKVGGREGIRTPDPLLAKQVLSQLSYTPTITIAF